MSDRRGSALNYFRSRLQSNEFVPIWVATILLFAIGGIAEPSSLSSSALLAMLPYAAMLAIAAAGQTLVVQHQGLDLSVGGAISLAAVLVTHYPAGGDGRVVAGVALAIGATTLTGLLVGGVVAFLRVPALVVTLIVNTILLGFVYSVSGGFSSQARASLTDFTTSQTAGIPNTVIVATVVVAAISLLINSTVWGRRFVLVGGAPRAALIAGIRTRRYTVAAYAGAGACYGAAGALIGGFSQTPGLLVGEPYLLTTVAAVLLGGTAMTGGRGSVVASGIAALFVIQLGQLVVLSGGPTAVQLIIEGVIIAVAMAMRNSPLSARLRQRIAASRRRNEPPKGPETAQVGVSNAK